MRFPETPRIVFNRNPLDEVIFQLRYPRLYAIDERLPSDFQQEISDRYPLTEIREVFEFSFSEDTEANRRTRRLHDFLNSDRSVRVTLSSEFLAVSTKRYSSWDEFRPSIQFALEALANAYAVPVYSRVGLRYVDRITKNELGLSDKLWSELVRPSALGISSEEDINLSDVTNVQSINVIKLTRGNLRLLTRLDFDENNDQQNSFVVDSDFYTENGIENNSGALEICDGFRIEAGNLFRWIILPELRNALEPIN